MMQMTTAYLQRRSIAAGRVMVALFTLCLTVLNCQAADFTSKDYPVGSLPTNVLVYDFNGDGKPDRYLVLSSATQLFFSDSTFRRKDPKHLHRPRRTKLIFSVDVPEHSVKAQ